MNKGKKTVHHQQSGQKTEQVRLNHPGGQGTPTCDAVSRRSFLQRLSAVVSAAIAAKFAVAQAGSATEPVKLDNNPPKKPQLSPVEESGGRVTTYSYACGHTSRTTYVYDPVGTHVATITPIPRKPHKPRKPRARKDSKE